MKTIFLSDRVYKKIEKLRLKGTTHNRVINALLKTNKLTKEKSGKIFL